MGLDPRYQYLQHQNVTVFVFENDVGFSLHWLLGLFSSQLTLTERRPRRRLSGIRCPCLGTLLRHRSRIPWVRTSCHGTACRTVQLRVQRSSWNQASCCTYRIWSMICGICVHQQSSLQQRRRISNISGIWGALLAWKAFWVLGYQPPEYCKEDGWALSCLKLRVTA